MSLAVTGNKGNREEARSLDVAGVLAKKFRRIVEDVLG